MTASDRILERLMTLHPKVIDLTLHRMERLLSLLGNPETKLPSVTHVAGTNGKGSTLAMIRAGLEGGGARVHAYTSPHLVRFNERIRLAGELIGEDALTATLEECDAANGGAPITYFEITTCAALLAMSRAPADHTLLEVGLGGRFDATNVIASPRVCVITPVSLDHQQYLGDTLEKIAAEKAGILKPGATCVVARQEKEALKVIEDRAERVGAPLLIQGRHWDVFEEHERLVFQDGNGLLDLPPPRLAGGHQIENAGTALAALRHLGVDEATCEAAMTGVVWPARLQRLTAGPLVEAAGSAELWLDGGHNPAAGLALARALRHLPPRPLHLVCGMLNTKDVGGYLSPLAGVVESLTAVDIPGESATLAADDTAAAARIVGLAASVAPDTLAAVTEIASQAPGSRVLICGSLHLAGGVLSENG